MEKWSLAHKCEEVAQATDRASKEKQNMRSTEEKVTKSYLLENSINIQNFVLTKTKKRKKK